MIGKQSKGSNFIRLLNYLFSKPGAELIGGNMIGETPEELAAEFRFSANNNSRVKKPVFHAILSSPKLEHLNDETWNRIASEYMTQMQFTANSYAVIRHSDRDHDHIHIASSRVRLDERSSCVKDSWDRPRSEKILRELEKKYNLTPTQSSSSKDRRAPTTAECRMLEQTGNSSVKTQLQDTIDAISQQQPTMPEFIGLLKDRGIDVKVKFTPTGDLGISYSYQGIATSGSKLGRAYTFLGLQKHRGISYSEARDSKAVLEESQRPPRLSSTANPDDGTDSDDTTNPLLNISAPKRSQPVSQNPLEQPELLPTKDEEPDGDDTEPRRAEDSGQKPSDANTGLADELTQLLELQLLRNHIQALEESPESDKDAEWFEQQEDSTEPSHATQASDIPQDSDLKTQVSDIPSDSNLTTQISDIPSDSDAARSRLRDRTPVEADSEQPPLQDDAIPVYPVEQNWAAVRENLDELLGLPQSLLEPLHDQGWLYANTNNKAVFSLRTLSGEQTGAYVFDPQTETASSIQDPDSPGYFWVATSDTINKAVITTNPIETLEAIAIDPSFRNNNTLYISVDNLDKATEKFLVNTEEVFICSKATTNDQQLVEELVNKMPHSIQFDLDTVVASPVKDNVPRQVPTTSNNWEL